MDVAARDLFNHLWIHFLLQIWTLYVPVTSDCTGITVYTNSSGVVTSPGYPSTFYGYNLDCTWYIILGTDEYPAINITDLYLDYSEDCLQDFLEITDQGNVLARLCGTTNELPIFLIGKSNVVAVRFVTDNGGTDRGFSFEWATSYEPATVRATSYLTGIYFNTTTTTTNAAGPVIEEDFDDWVLLILFVPFVIAIIVFIVYIAPRMKLFEKCGKEQPTPAPSPAPSPAPAPAPAPAPKPATSKTNKVNVEPPVKPAPPKPKPKKVPSPDGPHIFLSFDASDYKYAILLKEKMKEKGYRVYSGGRESVMMEDTIKKSAAIVPMLSKKFQKNKQCKKELRFADECEKPLVPVRVVKSFRLKDNWLGFLLGATLFYDLSTPDTKEQQMIHFLESIENVGSSAKLPKEEDDADEEAEAEAEAAKVEAAKTEAAKMEAAKTEAAKTEAAKTETVQAQLTVVNEQTSIGLSLSEEYI